MKDKRTIISVVFLILAVIFTIITLVIFIGDNVNDLIRENSVRLGILTLFTCALYLISIITFKTKKDLKQNKKDNKKKKEKVENK